MADRRLRGGHHYGVVLVLTAATLVWSIAAPNTDVSRGIGIALQGVTLLVVLLTTESPRLRLSSGLLAVTVAAAVLSITGAVPEAAAHGIWGTLALATLGEVVAGAVRLIRVSGVTAQVVMGGVVIYLLVGIAFALAIGVEAGVTDRPWFAQATDGTLHDRVYFSFAALTTTGFGDLTAGTPAARATTVVEMLTGQLYLVTVIGVLVSGVARWRRA